MDLNGIKAAVRHGGTLDHRRDFNKFALSLRGGEDQFNRETMEFRDAFCESENTGHCRRTLTLALSDKQGKIVWPRHHTCKPIVDATIGLVRGDKANKEAATELKKALEDFQGAHGQHFELLPLVFVRGICDLSKSILKEHQLQALCRFVEQFSYGQPCGLLLAHFMGTGKTLTSIACLTCLKALFATKGENVPVVVVTPDAIRGSFVSEWQNWTMCHELPKDCGEDLVYEGVSKEKVNVFGYAEIEAMFRDKRGAWFADKVKGSILVLDETHNVVRQRDRSVQENWHEEWAAMYDAYTSAGHVLCLTGTPIEKDAKDIVPLLNLVTSVREGRAIFPTSLSQFRQRFEKPITKGLFVRKFLSPVFNTIPAGAAKDFVLTTIAKKMGVDGSPVGLFTTLAGAWAGTVGAPALATVTALSIARMAYMNVYMQSYTQPLNTIKLYDLRADKFARVAQGYIDYANFEGQPVQEGQSEFPEKIMVKCPKATYNLYQMAKVWSNAYEASEKIFGKGEPGSAVALKDLFLDLVPVVFQKVKSVKNLYVQVLYNGETIGKGTSLTKVKKAVEAHYSSYWLRTPTYTIKVFEQKYSRRVFLRQLDNVENSSLQAMGNADLKPPPLEFIDTEHRSFDAVESHVSAVLNFFPAYGEHITLTAEGRLQSTSPIVAQELERVFSYNPVTGEELALVAWDQDERRTRERIRRIVGNHPSLCKAIGVFVPKEKKAGMGHVAAQLTEKAMAMDEAMTRVGDMAFRRRVGEAGKCEMAPWSDPHAIVWPQKYDLVFDVLKSKERAAVYTQFDTFPNVFDGLLPGPEETSFTDHPFVLYILMRQGGAQLVDLTDPAGPPVSLKNRRLAWRVFREGAFTYVGFDGADSDPAKVAFAADRLDNVPKDVQNCYRIGLAKDTSPNDPVTNRKVQPVVFNRDGTRDTLHCVLIHPLITEGMSLYAVRQMHVLEPIPSAAKYQQVVARAVRDGSHNGVAKEDRNVRVYRWVCATSGVFGYDDPVTVPKDLVNDLMAYVRGYRAPKAAECDLETMRAGMVMEQVRQKVNAAAIGQIDSKTGSVSHDERVDLMCRKGEEAIEEMNKVMGTMSIDGASGFYPVTDCKK